MLGHANDMNDPGNAARLLSQWEDYMRMPLEVMDKLDVKNHKIIAANQREKKEEDNKKADKGVQVLKSFLTNTKVTPTLLEEAGNEKMPTHLWNSLVLLAKPKQRASSAVLSPEEFYNALEGFTGD